VAYGIEKFKVGEVSTFIDIGACGGTISLNALQILAPERIISLEPCKETFEILLNTNKNTGNAFECYNVCYGSGESLYYIYKRAKGMRRFLTHSEINWDRAKKFFARHPTYLIESKSLNQMFEDYNIDADKPYIIKIDCEGCERFLLENVDDVIYIRNSLLFTGELHFFNFDFNGTPRAESKKGDDFASWLYSNFFHTNDITILSKRSKPVIAGSLTELVDYFSSGGRYRYIKISQKEG